MLKTLNFYLLQNVLNNIGSRDVKNGRRRANPFESISNGIFLNRAAMKMANLDAILNWMFTQPKDLNGVGIESVYTSIFNKFFIVYLVLLKA